MKRRKTPPERKADEYASEYRYEAWHSAHADRRKRPLAKAIEQRLRRRTVRQSLPAQPMSVTPEEADELTTAAAPAGQPEIRHVSTAVPLAEHLRRNQQRRLKSAGRKYFRVPYSSKEHRKSFARFLENVVRGGTGDSHTLASLFNGLFQEPFVALDARGIREHLQGLIQLDWSSETDQQIEALINASDEQLMTTFSSWSNSRAAWLQAFFNDEPAWRDRLNNWVQETLASSAT